MTIQLNGERRQITEGMSVAALLKQLEIRADRVAVEVNLEIMDKNNFETRVLQEGDRVEVMSFIGGGQHEDACFSFERWVSSKNWCEQVES